MKEYFVSYQILERGREYKVLHSDYRVFETDHSAEQALINVLIDAADEYKKDRSRFEAVDVYAVPVSFNRI